MACKSSEKAEARSAQQDVQGENLNDFVAFLSAGGKLKQHAEHDDVRRPERQINKFTRYPEKNRFSNAILFSQGSIDLVPEEKSDSPYIHASRIPCPGGALILAQAPMKDTVLDFYRMIWQQRVSTIVTLVNLNDKLQCSPYFERKQGKKTTLRNRFRVRTIAVRNEGKNIINYELKIENYTEKKEAKERVLNVISILGWEANETYDVKTIVAAIHSASALHKIGPQVENGRDAPMLIHGCSGIRRTGVFALAYIFSKQILGTREINLIGVTEAVRMVRYGVLRQKRMFYFLLEIIVSLITETGQLKPGSPDHMQVQATIKKVLATVNNKKGSGGAGKKGGKKKGASVVDLSEKSESSKTNNEDDQDEDGGGGEDEEEGDKTGKKSPAKSRTSGSKEARKKKK